MNEDQLNDLKQFIAATVSQTEARLTERLNTLESKVDDGFSGVGDALGQSNEVQDDFDQRLTRLEQQTA